MFETRKTLWRGIVMIGLLSVCAPALAQDETDLSVISLESLMNVQVSSVSRHQEDLRESPAAIFVITAEDIRRSGMTDVAELLRMVPGLNVAQINSHTWAISARGFNEQYSTKLLVLVDGRTVYDPTFSGVYWHLQNMVLEDIERIEIIRGPGATMWGANAVNGVISIRMKSAADTHGGLVVASAGNGRPGEGSFRFGDALGRNASYRVYGRQTTRSGLETSSGADGQDSWNLTNMGFRIDWKLSESDSFTFEGDMYRGVRGNRQPITLSLSPINTGIAGLMGDRGGHVRAKWNHTFNPESSLTFQFYVNDVRYTGYGAGKLRSVDFDVQHNFRIGKHQNFTWGFGRRETNDDFPDTPAFGLDPSTADTDLTSAFVQDEIQLFRDRLHITIGSKFEHSTLAGYNVQPSLRLAWIPGARHAIWASAGRAVRTVSRAARGIHVNAGSFQAGPLTGLVEVLGQKNTRNEGLMAYESGYRYQVNRRLWTDVTAFYNVYDDLSMVLPGSPTFTPQPSPHIVLPLYFANVAEGTTHGLEVATNFKVTDRWTLRGSYSLLRMNLKGPAGTTVAETTEGQTPRQQIHAASFLTFPKAFELSTNAYFVGPLRSDRVPSYTRLDAGLTWKGLERAELSLNGQNLLGAHQEVGQSPAPPNLVRRSIFGRIAWRF
jgi:iron complex outermembrane receptor protein